MQTKQWERLTVGGLKEILAGLEGDGAINDATVIWADSDPEGNGIHPLRQFFSIGKADDDFRRSHIAFGVGY